MPSFSPVFLRTRNRKVLPTTILSELIADIEGGKQKESDLKFRELAFAIADKFELSFDLKEAKAILELRPAAALLMLKNIQNQMEEHNA